jgi:hypothetical protein
MDDLLLKNAALKRRNDELAEKALEIERKRKSLARRKK